MNETSKVVLIKASLDPETEALNAEDLRVARQAMRAGMYSWLEAGQRFAAIKKRSRGAWGPWCRENYLSPDSADRLIRVFNRFGGITDTASDAEALQIDFRALEVLSSPSVPKALAEEAVARAAAGERISKAEAQEMVERARAEAQVDIEQTIAEQRRDIIKEARAKVAEQVAELESRITDDADERKALKKRIKELDEVVNGKRSPDLDDVERVISRYTGKRQLSKLLIQSLAKEIGKAINYNGVTYPPVDPATTQAREEQIQRNQAMLRALTYFMEAPEVSEIIKDMPRHHITAVIKLAPTALRWIGDILKAAEKAGRN